MTEHAAVVFVFFLFYGRTKESKFYFRTSRLRRSKLTSQFFVGIHLQLLDDVLGTRELEVVHLRLTGSVGDLAVVDDEGVPQRTVAINPADLLGERDVVVGHEELLVGQYGPCSFQPDHQEMDARFDEGRVS